MPRPTQLESHKDYSVELTAMSELFNAKGRGGLVTHIEIEQATGLEHGVKPWQHVIGKFKRLFLKETGYAIRSERGVGYRTMTVTNQIVDNAHRRKALRELHREVAEKVAIRDAELTPEQKKLQAAFVHQSGAIITDLRTAESERKSFLASPDAVHGYLRVKNVHVRASMENAS